MCTEVPRAFVRIESHNPYKAVADGELCGGAECAAWLGTRVGDGSMRDLLETT
jgi:hypothetical protein